MFEIPADGDENFWEDLPLEDITNSSVDVETRDPQHIERTNVPEDQLKLRGPCQLSPKNGHPSFSAIFNRNQDEKEGTTPILSNSAPHQSRKTSHHKDHLLTDVGNTTPHVFVPESQDSKAHSYMQSSHQASVNTPSRSIDQGKLGQGTTRSELEQTANRASRKRKRKFPGPAGLLPKLGHPQALDSPDLQIVPTKDKSPEQILQKDEMIMSSQSGEDIFNELPWQTLVKDLGNEAQDVLRRFSIASSLYKARKKLLPKGKVPLVLAVVESLDCSGTDASVCLKDKSGKISGSLHHSLMKEYEVDLQPGCALVLRQVSVISPTSRNHYLNITPSNVVNIYSNKGSELRRIDLKDNCANMTAYMNILQQEAILETTPCPPDFTRRNLPTPRSNSFTPNASRTLGSGNFTPHSGLNLFTPNSSRVPGQGNVSLQSGASSFTPNSSRTPGPSNVSLHSGANSFTPNSSRIPEPASFTPQVRGTVPPHNFTSTPNMHLGSDHVKQKFNFSPMPVTKDANIVKTSHSSDSANMPNASRQGLVSQNTLPNMPQQGVHASSASVVGRPQSVKQAPVVGNTAVSSAMLPTPIRQSTPRCMSQHTGSLLSKTIITRPSLQQNSNTVHVANSMHSTLKDCSTAKGSNLLGVSNISDTRQKRDLETISKSSTLTEAAHQAVSVPHSASQSKTNYNFKPSNSANTPIISLNQNMVNDNRLTSGAIHKENTLETVQHSVNNTPKSSSRWKFKASRKLSPENSATVNVSSSLKSSSTKVTDNYSSAVSTTSAKTEGNDKPSLDLDSHWQDDLSDDILSQLSEEMI